MMESTSIKHINKCSKAGTDNVAQSVKWMLPNKLATTYSTAATSMHKASLNSHKVVSKIPEFGLQKTISIAVFKRNAMLSPMSAVMK